MNPDDPIPKQLRVSPEQLRGYAALVAGKEDQNAVSTWRVWAAAALVHGLPCTVAPTQQPRTTTLGSYVPAWLAVLLEVVSPRDCALPDSHWKRLAARQHALSAAWRLGGLGALLEAWRA